MADNRRQEVFGFELPVAEICNSESRLVEKFHGRNLATSAGALPPELAHASKYQFSHVRGLILRSDRVAKIENSIMAVSKLPPEFGRSERFDGIFFLDLPGQEEKNAIWKIYLDLFAIDQQQRMPDDTDWTGAEIKACCRLSALLDVSLLDAAQNVVPVAVTASESVERLRTWASGRCLSASEPGIYQRDGAGPKPRRRLNREIVNN